MQKIQKQTFIKKVSVFLSPSCIEKKVVLFLLYIVNNSREGD